jgi:hypothetical protein
VYSPVLPTPQKLRGIPYFLEINFKITKMENEYIDKHQKFGLPGIWIPSEVLLNTKLTSTEKLLFGIIANLAKSDTGCFARNQFLAKLMGLKNQSITNGISNLRENGYILVNFVKNSAGFDVRHIYINPTFPMIYNKHHDICTPLLNELYPPITELITL